MSHDSQAVTSVLLGVPHPPHHLILRAATNLNQAVRTRLEICQRSTKPRADVADFHGPPHLPIWAHLLHRRNRRFHIINGVLEQTLTINQRRLDTLVVDFEGELLTERREVGEREMRDFERELEQVLWILGVVLSKGGEA